MSTWSGEADGGVLLGGEQYVTSGLAWRAVVACMEEGMVFRRALRRGSARVMAAASASVIRAGGRWDQEYRPRETDRGTGRRGAYQGERRRVGLWETGRRAMHRRALAALVVLACVSVAQAQGATHNDPYNVEYVPDLVLVKFADDVDLPIQSQGPAAKLAALPGLAAFWRDNGVVQAERLFPRAQANGPARKITAPDGTQHPVGSLHNILRLTLSAGHDPKVVAERLAGQAGVEYAEVDPIYYASEGRGVGPPPGSAALTAGSVAPKRQAVVPDDPLYGEQWYLGPYPGVNAKAAWELTTGDSTQVIAIIDTGVDWDHSDLDDNIWNNADEIPGNAADDDGNGFVDDIRGWDFVNQDNNPDDDNSHGTHVAGIAAAEAHNGIGISGVAPYTKIMPIKVLQSTGRGSSSDIAQGIAYAASEGATVINMSLGGYLESLTLKSALETAYATSVLVAAAGNDQKNLDFHNPALGVYTASFPACYAFVIGVEATQQFPVKGLFRSSFSNFDPSGPTLFGSCCGFQHNYEVQAPGVAITSTYPNGNYSGLSGTSMATPLVSGAIALLRTKDPHVTTEEIFARLVQLSSAGIVDIQRSMLGQLAPSLRLEGFALVDSVGAADNDGVADAGETIELYPTIRNTGALADASVVLRLNEFEDSSVANVLDSTTSVGTLSPYATSRSVDPIRITIGGDVSNGRDISFAYEIVDGFSGLTSGGGIVLTVQRGAELLGILDSTLVLTPDRFWLVNGSFRLTSNGILEVLPGTHIKLDAHIYSDGLVRAHGTKDSVITVEGPRGIRGGEIEFVHVSVVGVKGVGVSPITASGSARFTTFEDFDLALEYVNEIEDCIFRDGRLYWRMEGAIRRNNFDRVETPKMCGDVSHNNFSRSLGGAPLGNAGPYAPCSFGRGNNLLSEGPVYAAGLFQSGAEETLPQYWGTSDSLKIAEKIIDFWDDAMLAVVDFQPFFEAPSDSAHGMVWKVELNGIDPQDEELEPIGVETVRFDVLFNRPMDVSHQPFLSFGVREPRTQRVVSDSSSWSADSSVWSAYYNVDTETGDGVNRIRVSGARDPEGFLIPVEDNGRFRFVVGAAAALADQFGATAGVGKVSLEWPSASADRVDVLGYNLYREVALTDSTFSDMILVNSALVTDSTYIDYGVTPGSTYAYTYRIVGTDLVETDPSRRVMATPVDAASGDANGDMSVNVLDIVAVVNFILEEAPQPFLLEAADANQDDRIDVLDVVRIVRVILGLPKAAQVAPSAGAAELALDGQAIVLRSTVPVAGLQFSVVGEGLRDLRLRPTPALSGMEIGSVVREGKATYLVYSLSRATLPTGELTLFDVQGGEGLSLENVILSDVEGRPVPTAVTEEELAGLPDAYSLSQNYPNPLNPETVIRYGLPAGADLRLTVYNLLGQEVTVLREGREEAGFHRVVWDGKDGRGRAVASGVYFYRLSAGRFVETRRMMVLK